MKRMIGVLVCFLLFLTSHVIYSAPILRFGVINFYPPFVFSTQSGYVYGAEIELAQALCKELNVQCTFTALPLTKLFSGLNMGKVDAILGAISITPHRQQVYDFTSPYYKSTMSYVILSTTADIDPNNLAGKRVGVLKDSTFYKYLSDRYKNAITLKTYETNEALMEGLSNDRVEVILIDTPAANYWVNYSNGLFKLVGTSTILPFDEGYGILVKKGNSALTSSLDKALNTLRQSGTLNKILQTYFPTETAKRS